MNIKINISATLAGLLLTAALAVSCTKIHTLPDNDPQEIAMRLVETKASEPAPMAGDRSFGLFAYATESAGSTPWYEAWPAVASSVKYLDNVSFAHIEGSWVGCDFGAEGSKTHHPYYYPLSGSLLFAGYSPHKDASEGTITGVTFNENAADMNPYLAVTFSHVVEDNEADISKMPDLMWFDVKDANQGMTAGKTSDAIALTFRHALSKVSLNFTDTGFWYRLKDVRLTGCIYSGTFYSGKTAGWLPEVEKVADYILPIETQTQGDKTIWPLLDGRSFDNLFFIPQYLNGIFPVLGGTIESEVDVKLVFTVTGGDNYGEQTVEILLKDHTERWEIGKHYTYNVAVNADPIDFGAPTVTITTQTVAM